MSKNPVLRLFKRNIKDNYAKLTTLSTEDNSRRRFIKNSAMASIALSIPSTFLSSCSEKVNINSPRIAIIGGGIAGLHAGHIFKKASVGFTIFEASERVGGRIFSIKNQLGENLTTEMGGEFIDSNHEDMLNLVKEYNLSLLDLELDLKKSGLIKDAYFFSGKHYSEKELTDEFSKFSRLIAEDIQKVVEEEDETLFNSFDSISISDYLRNKGMNGWIFDLLTNAYTSEFGLESSEQSSLNLLYMLNPNYTDGFKIFGDSDERYKIIGGNSQLTDLMYEKLKNEIKLKYQLSKLSEKDGLYKLEFSNGEQFEFDYVILSIPFSVLRKIELNLELPEEKTKAIQELGYGTSSKVILGSESRTWRSKGFSGYLFSDIIQNGWDSSIGENNDLDAGSYTVFLGGNAGKVATTEDIPKYGKAFADVFDSSEKFLNEKSTVFNWSNSPNFLGGYSAYKVGQWSTIAGYEKESVNNLFFAGEHCSEDFQGYMNGGAETGRIAAEAILEKIKSV
jgi:monoamine oxidase